jgi:hypothetical protein
MQNELDSKSSYLLGCNFSGGSRMVYRPFSSLGRFGLAACAVSLGVASLSAQTAPSTTAPVGPNPSRVDVFLGYSYFGAHGQLKPQNINYSSINYGATGSVAYYFNKYVGAEANIVVHNDGANDGFNSASGGMIVRAPMQNFTLFAHGLVGASRLVGPNSDATATFAHNPWTTGVTLTAGGGMDYDLPFFNNKFSLRLFQADYRYDHTDFGFASTVPTNGNLGGRANLSGVDLSTGIVAHFGHIIPPPPVTYSCAVSPATAYPGDPLTVTGTALMLDPKKTATYTWTATGGAVVSGGSNVGNIDTKSLSAGSYSVKGHVSEGSKPGQMADCSADFTVKAFEPPTVGCSANPSTVSPGDSSMITASGVSPQNRPLTYSYTASAGSISGTTGSATLSTTGAAPGTITVTCNAVDDKGQTASQTTTVTVVAAAAPPPAPTTQSLCSISFDRDSKRPTRVDNEGKACLDDLALNLQRTTDSKLAVVGNAATAEKMGPKKAAERAVNTKAYLVTDKGIDASRVNVYTGTQDAKTVSTTLVPSGATMDMTGVTPVDETAVKAIPRKALAPASKHKKHHHKK